MIYSHEEIKKLQEIAKRNEGKYGCILHSAGCPTCPIGVRIPAVSKEDQMLSLGIKHIIPNCTWCTTILRYIANYKGFMDRHNKGLEDDL